MPHHLAGQVWPSVEVDPDPEGNNAPYFMAPMYLEHYLSMVISLDDMAADRKKAERRARG